MKRDGTELYEELSLSITQAALGALDEQTARSAGVPFAAVLSGMTDSGEFDVFDPLAVLDSVGELPEFLDKGFPGKGSLDDGFSDGGQRFR